MTADGDAVVVLDDCTDAVVLADDDAVVVLEDWTDVVVLVSVLVLSDGLLMVVLVL